MIPSPTRPAPPALVRHYCLVSVMWFCARTLYLALWLAGSMLD